MSFGSEFGNPFLTPEKLSSENGDGAMSVGGTVAKLLFLLLILVGGASITWSLAYKAWDGFDFGTLTTVTTTGADGKSVSVPKILVEAESGPESSPPVYKDVPKFDLSAVTRWMWVGLICGFLLALVIIFNPRTATFLSSPYAFCEGLALGGISAMYEIQFGGIVMQAAVLSLGVLVAMAILYMFGIVRSSGKFTAGLLAMIFGVLLLYIADALMIGFGGKGFSIIHGNSWTAIGFSAFVCLLAAFSFVVDFATIEDGVAQRAPKHMEWYAAFGILVTLVWLYLEILRLLAKLKSKDSSSK